MELQEAARITVQERAGGEHLGVERV